MLILPWLIGGGMALQSIGNWLGQRKANQRQGQIDQLLMGQLGQQRGPGQAETMLLDWITGGGQGFDPSHLFTGEGFNTGQDALMQMTRAQPFDTTELFAALEPIEERALGQALDQSFAQASGLGQRFGSAQMVEEGRVRGQAAEGAAARREGIAQQTYESAQQRALQAAQLLGQFGISQAGLGLQALGGLGGMEQNRQGIDLQILAMLAGQPIQPGTGSSALSALGGAGQDIGQFLYLLPFLQSLGGGGGGAFGGIGMGGGYTAPTGLRMG